jgi:hypothetical protein
MIGICGTVKLKDKLTDTQYFWGDPSEITGKTLQLIEQNERGDCMCLTPKGLVDVSKDDIESVSRYETAGVLMPNVAALLGL